MKRRAEGAAVRTILAALALVWLAAVGLASGAGAPAAQANGAPGASASAAAPAQSANGYVGDETCTTCHEPEGKTLLASLHGKAANPRAPAGKTGQACETCHGPGQAHVDAGDKTHIKRFAAMPSREANATCLTCHSKGSHSEFQGSMHDARNVSCVTCHSVHTPKSQKAQLKTVSVAQTCETCHKQESMKVRKFGHMPVREGKMDCVSCHSPHGSTNVRMLKVGNHVNESCASCHAEKRGPFLWEHSAARENCASCHDPHGSNNDRMLIAKEPMLCQRCHVASRHPATIYDGTQIAAASNRVVGRRCVNCHSNIHGSNHPAGDKFLR